MNIVLREPDALAYSVHPVTDPEHFDPACTKTVHSVLSLGDARDEQVDDFGVDPPLLNQTYGGMP